MALTTKDKKELALSLFLHSDQSQKELAARVGVSENTLSTWANDGGWKTLKGARTATRPQMITELYQQLTLIKEAAVDAQGKRRPMTHTEVQSVKMITKSISELDKKLAADTYMQVVEELMTWLFESSPEEAKRMLPRVDSFMAHKFKSLG
jgi:transposase